MKLAALGLENVRAAPDGSFSFTDRRTGAPLDVAVVTGAPRSGKTAVLEAIAAAKEAIGSYGAPIPSKRLLRRGATRGRIVTTWLLSDDERAHAGLDEASHTVTWDLGGDRIRAEADPRLRRLFAEFSRDSARGKLEYFPANRRLEPWGALHLVPISEPAEARLRPATDAEKYAHLVRALYERRARDAERASELLSERGIATRDQVPDSLAPFKEAIAALLPDLRLATVELRDGAPLLRFLRRDRSLVELHEVSASEQQAVLFALAFRHLGLCHSLVLVDEPELHVHASERVSFLRALVALGSDNQLVVATGSEEIVRAASPGQVIDLSRVKASAESATA